MEILFYLAIFLFFVMLIGHGMWVVCAWILRGCRPRESYEPTVLDDRAATARHLEYLRREGFVSGELHKSMLQAIADEEREARLGLSHRPVVHASTSTAEEIEKPAEKIQGERPAWKDAHERSTRSGSSYAETIQPVGKWVPISEAVKATPESSKPTIPQPAPEPRRPFGEVLMSFMAEKNIRWGELVGGLLILCCSTALVISLWSQIEAIPVLKFVIFTSITAALFGVGLFVHHRWKLPTTGHALLIVSSLLVPLNLLAFAALSHKTAGITASTVGLELGSVALFGWLLFLAGRILMPTMPGLFAMGIVGLSACSLLVRHARFTNQSMLIWLCLLPIAAYAAILTMSLRREAHRRRISETQARRLFLQLGGQTLACIVPLSLVFFEFGQVLRGLHLFSPILCALAAPAFVTGLFIYCRAGRNVAPQTPIIAMSISLVSAAVTVASVGLAWPLPIRLMPALLINAVGMLTVSRVARHAGFHAAGALWVSAAWVLAVHLITGRITWATDASQQMLTAILSAQTGQALVAPVLICLLIAELLRRSRVRRIADGYLGAGVSLASLSVLAATAYGFAISGDTQHVAWVYFIYAVVAFALAWRMNTAVATIIGCLLAQAGLVQIAVYVWHVAPFPWATSLLIGATVCTGANIIFRFLSSERIAAIYAIPLARMTVLFSLLASVGLAITASQTLSLDGLALRALWFAILWACVASANGWPLIFAGAQIAGFVALGFAVQAHIAYAEWYRSFASALREQPRLWQAHLNAASGLCFVFASARLIVMRLAAKPAYHLRDSQSRSLRLRARDLMTPEFPAVDRFFSALLIVAVMTLAARALWPAIAVELGALKPVPVVEASQQAAAGASWVVVGIVAAILTVHLFAGHLQSRMAGFFILLACASALFAARFEAQHGVVVVWRFLLAALFLLTSSIFWTRSYWAPRVQRLVLPITDCQAVQSLAQLLTGMLFAFPVIVLTASHTAALSMSGTFSPWGTSSGWLRLLLLTPSAILAVTLIGYGLSQRMPIYAVAAAFLGCAAAVGTEVAMLDRARHIMSPEFVVWLLQLAAMISAAVAITWYAIRAWLGKGLALANYPSWPLLLVRAAMLLVFALLIAMVAINPRFIHPAVNTAGGILGLLAVIAVETALFTNSDHAGQIAARHRNAIWLFFVVSLGSFAVARFDANNWLCFHVLLVGFTLAGWTILYVGSTQLRRMMGAGWQQVFAVAIARASGRLANIEHDLSCTTCGYNLRTQPTLGVCPECGNPVMQSLDAALGKLTPDYATMLAQARVRVIGAVLGFAAIATTFAMRAAAGDPQRPWWSAAAMVVLSGLCMALAGWAPQRTFAWLGGLGMCVAASVWYLTLYSGTMVGEIAGPVNLANVNVVALALAGIAWLVAERTILVRHGGIAQSSRHPDFWPAFHHAALAITVAACLALACIVAKTATDGQPVAGISASTTVAGLAVLGLVIALFREPIGKLWLGSLYIAGVSGLVQLLSQNGLQSRTLVTAICVGLAAYACVASILERLWTRLARTSPPSLESGARLAFLNNSVALVSVCLALFVSLNEPASAHRLSVVGAPVLLAISVFLLSAYLPPGSGQTIVAGLAGLGAILFSWTWIPPDMPAVLLHRSVGVFAAMVLSFTFFAVMAGWIHRDVLCATSGPSASAPGAVAVKRYLLAAGALAAVALLYCSGLNAAALLKDTLLMAGPAVTAMIIAICACIITCMAAAASSRFDPLQIRIERRGAYVYIAEVLAALLTLHIRANMPWLFTGLIEQYWPALILSIAFAAVVIGETLEGYGMRVVGKPLSRTGTYLPLVTSVELFIAASRINYSAILLAVGAFYAVLAAMRRSASLAVLAAASFNGSLWYLLYHTPGLGLNQHPQLWFIPPALAVLAAAHLGRVRLNASQLRALHYGCLLVIYLSSSADVFLIGVAQAPWLPLVLAGLSVAGIFVGFAMRLRSFLMLGMGFLCLSLFTMIWHAATNLGWTWVWYVAGIALGIGIIIVFALFERKRAEMDAWMEHLKKWAE